MIIKNHAITIAIALALLTTLRAGAAVMPQPSFHTKGSPTGKATGKLKPGEYWWNPHRSPAGPVTVLVSLPLQTMHVYRNGILVGRSSISSGSKGHQTPTGVFTILEKKQEHRSKKYDNAPMPNMQRLTWCGIAMHSGHLPGYPASHGCIRMPYDFSLHLFDITGQGGTVVIGDDIKAQPHFAANPGTLLAPKNVTPEMVQPLAKGESQWHPERATEGPVSAMISGADRTVYVYRNGHAIGRSSIEVRGRLGEELFTMLEGPGEGSSPFAPGRPNRKWMEVATGRSNGRGDITALAKRVKFPSEFSHQLYDALKPGATIIVTNEPAVRNAKTDFTILDD